MIKQKFIDRPEVTQIIERRYVQKYIESPVFRGYLGLLDIKSVSADVFVTNDYGRFQIIGEGFKWLHIVPDACQYVVTAMFNPQRKLSQLYIDIIARKGLENGRVYFDDIYLDIVYIVNKPPLLLDEDDLAEALRSGIISEGEALAATKVATDLIKEISSGSNSIVRHVYDFMALVTSSEANK